MIGRFVPVRKSGSFFLLAFLTLTTIVRAQGGDEPIPRAQDRPPGPALSPQEAMARMTVPPGFRVELVASEPDIVNPVAMTFDERGRVWITESLEYPRQSPGPGRDRVKILEDTDGDGAADKFTVFADGLNIPSGIAVGAGGVWVANAPDILFFKDTDGDGVADSREVVVTGFGRYDTHELPNSLTWGPDGYLYGWNGVFNPAKIDHKGKHFEFTCAVFRIDPRTRDFEIFCEGTSNPWGIAWNEDGDAFASACVIDHLWHLTETGYYHRQGGPYPPFTWKLESIVDHKHQKAAYCGITFLDSDAFPEKYRNRLFFGNIHGNAINVDRLEKRGATYIARSEPDFLTANDAWFMPVVQKVGPDGSLYILDWYDRYHCYQDANRDPKGVDRLKGRLYRVRYGDTPRAPKFDLVTETDDQLIARLDGPNGYYRETARRLLAERRLTDAASKKLYRLSTDTKAPRRVQLNAVWALMAKPDATLWPFAGLLGDEDALFEAWSIRASGNHRRNDELTRRAFAEFARDKSPVVRLQVAIAARKLGGTDALPILFDVAAHTWDDVVIPAIVWQNLAPMLDNRGADFARLATDFKTFLPPGLAQIFARSIDRLLGVSDVQAAEAADILAALLNHAQEQSGLEASRQALTMLATRLRDGGIPAEDRAILRERITRSLAPILAEPDKSPLAFEAAILATAWNDPAAVTALRRILAATQAPEAQRLHALNALIASKDATVLDSIAPILAEGPVGFRGELLGSLGRLDSPKVAEIVLKAYPQLGPELRPRAIGLLTQRDPWSRALLDAIVQKTVDPNAVDVNQIRKLAATRDPELAGRIKAVWGTVRESRNPAREQVIERTRATLKDVHGDPVAGAVVFKNLCGQCHKIYGEGQEVGPEITLNGRASYEQLLSNVFDPSLVIGPAYQATTVATADGRVLTGLLAEDSPQQIVLKTPGGKLETIPRSQVEESKISPLSLMPEGIEGQINARELADLFAYITLDRPPTDPEARPLPGTPPGIRKSK